uniref:Uncharacterized protein LOC113787798 n=1 Tax=Cicer arietinum TaxID=3827 RepID=A0A3Q7XH48_CICAR|nr:uncharacterized protein LOC113787798 [Cicer arietinum]
MATPQVTKEKPSSSNNVIVDAIEFCNIVGALEYLTFTRPDITHVVQLFTEPTVTDLKGLRYLYNTFPSLYGFSDADSVDCTITRQSTTCYCVFIGANCISWSSKKQSIVSCSSTEAEYRSMAHTVAKLTWITYLFHDTCVYLPRAPQLFCDNISALHMTINPVFHACTKHIEFDYHFVSEKIAI